MCISYNGDCLIVVIAVSVITVTILLSLYYNLLRFVDQYLPHLCLGRG
jgi:hypothetical protein